MNEILLSDTNCFGCGQNNPIGLKLTFHEDNESIFTDFKASKNYCGWDTIVHGGIVATVLDEVIAQAAINQLDGLLTVTAKLSIEFLRPVHEDEVVRARAKTISKEGKRITMEGTIKNLNGEILAIATALLIIVSKEKLESLAKN